MKLTYQTGIATLIQFVLLSFLTLVSQIASVVSTCRTDSSNCISNLITSIIFYIVVAVVFGGIWLIGLAAQNLRSKRLGWLVICIEGLIGVIALFTVKLSLHHGHKNVLGTLASLSIAVVALWTVTLAWRITRFEGQRIRTGGRRRRHPSV
ncbi:MAG TPA: hypothetical protein VHA37_05725 [Candidatus Saccharimonadales bacterium]|nr:hypothetical protein [Candidatus Saccharimonadales bacterium]